VKFSLERAIDIADPAGPSTLLYNLRRVDAKGQTVTMHLRRADATWPSLLSHTVSAIVPRRVFPARRLLADRKVIGSGPYTLDRYTRGRRAVLSRNTRYSGSAKPKTKTVTVAYYASGAALKTAIEQGAVDVAFRGFSAAEIAALRAQPGVQVLEGPGAEIHYLVFDLAKVPNVLVRQAVAQVVDRSALASAAYADTVTPLHSMVPAAVPGAKPSFQAIYGAPDAEHARRLLAAAGLTPPVALDAWYTPSRYGPEEQAGMAEIRRQLEATGLFTVTLGATQWDAFKEDAFSRHRYSSYALGWFPDYLDADNFLSPFVRDGGFVANGYENATVNRNLDLQLRTTREPARLQIIGELQDAVARDVPLLPLWERKQIAVVRPGVAGVQESFDASLQLRFSLLSKP
jgi:peptide/nickel transport system substrate-binding protein